jgi:hypothetical protein
VTWTWLARACRAAFDSASRSAATLSDGPSGSVISCRIYKICSRVPSFAAFTGRRGLRNHQHLQ